MRSRSPENRGPLWLCAWRSVMSLVLNIWKVTCLEATTEL